MENRRSIIGKIEESKHKAITTINRLLLNYFNGRVTNGFVEGMNNKIKLIKRKGFGFTNHNHFRYRVLDVFG